jgi:hypothetical protein
MRVVRSCWLLQCQLSCGFHNCRFIEAAELARSCVVDLIFPSEFTRAGTREHDGTLCGFEYHRHLMFAGTELDLKGASWEWSIYSHLAGLLTFGRANKEGADSRRP